MPSYVYECSECGHVSEVFHSMSTGLTDCIECESEKTLNKIPEVPTYVKHKTVGNVVKQHIEDAKQQVREDKKNLIREYK